MYRDYRGEEKTLIDGGLQYENCNNPKTILLTTDIDIYMYLKNKNSNNITILYESSEQLLEINAITIKYFISEIIVIEETDETAIKIVNEIWSKVVSRVNYNKFYTDLNFLTTYKKIGLSKVLHLELDKDTIGKFITNKRISEYSFYVLRTLEIVSAFVSINDYITISKINTIDKPKFLDKEGKFFLQENIKAIVYEKMNEILDYDKTLTLFLRKKIKIIKTVYTDQSDDKKIFSLFFDKAIRQETKYIGKNIFKNPTDSAFIADWIVRRNILENTPFKNIGNAIYAYNGKYWEGYTSDEFDSKVQEELLVEGHKFYHPRLFSEIRKVISIRSDLKEEANYFVEKRDSLLVPFQNGLFDPRSGELKPHTPDQSLNFIYDWNYDTSNDIKEPELWLRCLSDWGLDEETTFLQEFIGQMFSSDLHGDSKFLFLLGAGSNGKSVFIETLAHLINERNYARIGISEMSKPEYLIQIKDKTAVFSTEGSLRYLKESKSIKNAVHGEPLTVADKYEKAVTFTPGASFVFATNHSPLNADKSPGWLRRFEIVNFNKIFTDEEKDRTLINKLKKESDLIVAWAMRGYERYIANAKRYSKSSRLEENKKEYEVLNNPLFEFYSDKLIITKNKNDMISSNALYQMFQEYSRENGQDKTFKKKRPFLGELSQLIKTKNKFDATGTRLNKKDEYSKVCLRHGVLNCSVCNQNFNTDRGIRMFVGIKRTDLEKFDDIDSTQNIQIIEQDVIDPFVFSQGQAKFGQASSPSLTQVAMWD